MGVFYTKKIKKEREGKASEYFGSPKSRCMFDLFKIGLFKNYGQFLCV